METKEEILKEERDRIKAIIQRKKERIDILCERKKSRRGKRSIAKSRALEMLDDVIFWIDNPDYVRVKDRESFSIS